MQDATEFGMKLRELMAKNNLRQGQLAELLKVSPAILSNYIIGKNIPEMDFVAKCIKYFNLQDKEIKEIFTKYFSSIAKENGKIILDAKFFKPERIELLIEILTVLLLYTQEPLPTQSEEGNPDSIYGIKNRIRYWYKYLDTEVDYAPPSYLM